MQRRFIVIFALTSLVVAIGVAAFALRPDAGAETSTDASTVAHDARERQNNADAPTNQSTDRANAGSSQNNDGADATRSSRRDSERSSRGSHDQSGEHKYTNRLIDATSPYLLQHAHNPVDWYPWGEEAFEAAREQDKPIFLSVGYSTCYWCHVMERESFENEGTAAIMNNHVISVKLDREQRPDVDDIYMTATRILNRGRGGWPMSVFLEPNELKPFFAGTYFRRSQFEQIVNQIGTQWQRNRQPLLQRADQVSRAVQRNMSEQSLPKQIDASTVQRGIDQLLGAHDSQRGGFGGAPKFPQPARLELLLGAGFDDPAAREALLLTLDRMAMGGMYDQVGGGFHRYSTDASWLVPHFEKMLYDNGQLASLYARAHERTDDGYYADITRETLDYVLREMTGESGRFYSAQDAEVNHREGLNYIWTKEQFTRVLYEAGMEEEIDFALSVYGLDRGTNFQDPHHPEDGRKNVLFLPQRPDELAEHFGMSVQQFQNKVKRINETLLSARLKRPQPGTDDKTLTAWSGLMIAGFADGGRTLEESTYIEAARNAVEFILETMRTGDGGLLRSYREGTAEINGFLNDYAFFIHGLLALHEATGDENYVNVAEQLTTEARTRFWDVTAGGYYDTEPDQSDLFVRPKTTRDGAVPSGNSVMAHNLLDLYKLTGKQRYLEDAADTLAFLSSRLQSTPTVAPLATLSLHRMANNYRDYLPGGEQTDKKPVEPVSINLNKTDVNVAMGEADTFEITLNIEDGFHINANEPGHPDLVGVAVRAAGPGIEIDVDYPQGERYDSALFDETIRVHAGTVTIPVTVRQTAAVRGRPRFMVMYQVCTDELCYKPQREILPIRVNAASR